ncbi:MAG TPA: UvrB/UvrC motif-containing protein, partial [Candidatus Galloscillospira excrementipullorum]|nr:UvrB/UvrC motif-containing protein [Candidatus Galloscillospira excrementipullorum]
KVETDAGKLKFMSKKEREQLIDKLTKEMKQAAKLLEFEHAAYLRDKIEEIRAQKEEVAFGRHRKRD